MSGRSLRTVSVPESTLQTRHESAVVKRRSCCEAQNRGLLMAGAVVASDYSIGERPHHSASASIHRGLWRSDGLPVVPTRLERPRPNGADVSRLRREEDGLLAFDAASDPATGGWPKP